MEEITDESLPAEGIPPENLPVATNPGPEIITVTQNETPSNMEVHHHPDLHHKSRKWREYFLEFLMIFLAVTMGFIAENIREYFVDKRTEKEYLSSFKQQLLINKEQFSDLQNSFVDYKPALDSLARLFYYKDENKDLVVTARLLVKTKMLNLKTIDGNAYLQLVNSGGLRYIHNMALKDSMTRYADDIKAFENYNDFVLNYITQNILLTNSLEDWHDFFLDHVVQISAYPEISERERRAMVAYNKIRYGNALSNDADLKKLLALNKELTKIVDEELGK